MSAEAPSPNPDSAEHAAAIDARQQALYELETANADALAGAINSAVDQHTAELENSYTKALSDGSESDHPLHSDALREHQDRLNNSPVKDRIITAQDNINAIDSDLLNLPLTDEEKKPYKNQKKYWEKQIAGEQVLRQKQLDVFRHKINQAANDQVAERFQISPTDEDYFMSNVDLQPPPPGPNAVATGSQETQRQESRVARAGRQVASLLARGRNRLGNRSGADKPDNTVYTSPLTSAPRWQPAPAPAEGAPAPAPSEDELKARRVANQARYSTEELRQSGTIEQMELARHIADDMGVELSGPDWQAVMRSIYKDLADGEDVYPRKKIQSILDGRERAAQAQADREAQAAARQQAQAEKLALRQKREAHDEDNDRQNGGRGNGSRGKSGKSGNSHGQRRPQTSRAA